jgi:phosphonate transport system ATP-binding protein
MSIPSDCLATDVCFSSAASLAPLRPLARATQGCAIPFAPRGLIAVERLTVRRGGREILRDVSLAFGEATITAVVGPSGVGKTTLIAALNGLVRPCGGAVAVAGAGRLDNAAALKEARRITATIFQDHALIGRLSAIDDVLLGLADERHPLSLLPWPLALRERAALALDEVGLLHRATARTDQLSGGERQRVGIARALVRRPRLLLGDEPFASVDSALAARLGEELRGLVARSGVTVILVLHQLHLARTLADRIVGLSGGRVAFDGPADAFGAAEEKRIFGP